MIKKSIALVYFLFAAFFAQVTQAAIIFYNGHSGYSYSLDTSTNVITTLVDNENITEWLRWDETKGMSVQEALDKYEGQGWRTPTHAEVAEMLNSFNF